MTAVGIRGRRAPLEGSDVRKVRRVELHGTHESLRSRLRSSSPVET